MIIKATATVVVVVVVEVVAVVAVVASDSAQVLVPLFLIDEEALSFGIVFDEFPGGCELGFENICKCVLCVEG